MCLDYFFDMLPMGACKTRHWQTSGQPVQELNACTVGCKANNNATKDYQIHYVQIEMV